MMEQINKALEGFLGDQSLKAVIFDHNGKAFSAVVDIGDHIGDKATKMIKEFHGIFRTDKKYFQKYWIGVFPDNKVHSR